eukprot:CAMPEP_0197641482 /NCGR_PEP_ID=MMETSP1338-20131121/15439_1 /TAXON_ID=43686 ORGANISM="Pelagodinium beii, Strain RCC1491" /NCGR_SAMPLE_ID=MMETSP1338 /ASSEMBLY_ACC=CAM_ASM_000754 /LENGTH=211 /DNA_ID=CAMNT_0043214477 /DNA_START=76 /DNA_END=711 /DNA_ORIENTATION=+
MFSFLNVCKPQIEEASSVRVKVEDIVDALRSEHEETQPEIERKNEDELKRKEAQMAEAEAQTRALKLEEEVRLQAIQAAQAAEEVRLQEEKVTREVKVALKVAREAKARMEQERRERAQLVLAFLKQHGFTGVSSAKHSLMSTTYPLHKAAELGNAKLVAMLLKEGALPEQKNSSGKTAAEVAEKKNKDGSHLEVISILKVLPSRSSMGGA